MKLRISDALLHATFDRLRACGGGRRECQALWLADRVQPNLLSRLVHPRHSASAVGFQLDEDWLTAFWEELANGGEMVRVQIHTHPGAAYHSATDDAYPILAMPGFLSLVIPRFAQGSPDLNDAFLAEIDAGGCWRQVDIGHHLEIIT